jgi:hypothetical protein
VTPPPCTSGIPLRAPVLVVGTDPLAVTLKTEISMPGADPAASGLRVLVDSAAGPSTLDVTLPAGALWSVNAAGTQWKYVDPFGPLGGVRKVVVQDRSRKEPGLVKVTVKTKGGSAPLPSPADVRTTLVFGASEACAGLAWGAPSDPAPRCEPKGSRVRCR